MVTAGAATPAVRIPRVRYRFRFSLRACLSAMFGGLGLAVTLQQFAVAYPTRNLVLGCIVGGAVLYVLAVNLARVSQVSRLNGRLALAEAKLLATPTIPGFVATHVVGNGGAEAREEPDPALPASAVLDAGVELDLVEQRGGWAFVRGGNGWTGWVDAARLAEKAAP